MKKENLIKAAKDGARTFGELLRYCVLFVLVMAVVEICLSSSYSSPDQILSEMVRSGDKNLPEVCHQYTYYQLCDCFGPEHYAKLHEFERLCFDELRWSFSLKRYWPAGISFVVLVVYLLCAVLLYYKKRNDILLSWVYVVVLWGAKSLDLWVSEVRVVCLAIMLLLLIYQVYARVAKKKMLAVWWFAPHVCFLGLVLYQTLRVALCYYDYIFSMPELRELGMYNKCVWSFGI